MNSEARCASRRLSLRLRWRLQASGGSRGSVVREKTCRVGIDRCRRCALCRRKGSLPAWQVVQPLVRSRRSMLPRLRQSSAGRRPCAEAQSLGCWGGAGVGLAAHAVGGWALWLQASVGTERRLRRSRVVASATLWPNHSIERTCPGKPGHAAHVER